MLHTIKFGRSQIYQAPVWNLLNPIMEAQTQGEENGRGGSAIKRSRSSSPLHSIEHFQASERNILSKRISTSKMGSEERIERKPRFLCLHGFRTSGEILKKQVGKWPNYVLDFFDFDFLDGPFPATGKSDVEGFFDPPYFEWYQFNKNSAEYINFDQCLSFIENYMIKHGPFDGLLGFSQGAILSAGLPGLQAKGLALTKVPKIKFVVIIGGAKFRSPSVAEKAYASPIGCSSLHLLGERDFMKADGTELLESFIEPFVIYHPKGHTIPALDEKGLEIMESFIQKISKTSSQAEE